MITSEKNRLTVAKEDQLQLVNYLNSNKIHLKDEGNAALLNRLEEALVIDGDDFPWEAVRLHTRVVIRDKIARLNYTYIVVMPDQADHRKCKVSVFAPIGRALFGYRRGDDVYWSTQKGKRYFTIMAVSQMVT